MKIVVKGNPEELASLVENTRGQHNSSVNCVISIETLGKSISDGVQKAVLSAIHDTGAKVQE